jgi:hypothetical protein
MKCVANYEIKSDASVSFDDRWLKFEHPTGLYQARLRNITRKDFSTPFLLTLHLTFETPSLKEAKEVADDRLADCLNVLSLVTSCTFARHRIRQIVDASSTDEMRTVLYWGDAIENEDPQPILNPGYMKSVERLLAFDAPLPVKRALRWYRLGVAAKNPDDQYAYFWFALEILAVYQDSPEEVPEPCPVCKSALFCKTCEKNPLHKPYPRQKIRSLMQAVDKTVDDQTVKMLDTARNALMHGKTLKEIKHKLPEEWEEVVTVLGKILFKAIVHQIPKDLLREKISVGSPSTYVHRTISGVITMQTTVPKDDDGEFDLSFSGISAGLVADGPPQSAIPTQMVMSKAQFETLRKLAFQQGDQKEMLHRIFLRTEKHEGLQVTWVLATEAKVITEAVNRGDQGSWQDFFREMIEGGKTGDGAAA